MFKCRIAHEMDIEDLLDMLRLFHQKSPYCTIQWDADDASAYLFQLMDNGIIFVVEDMDGYLLGCLGFELGTMPFNANYWVALEKFFYVREHYRTTTAGARLHKHAEGVLKNEELADAVVMATLSTSPPHVEKWYGMKGYTKVESGYMKEIR